MEFADDEELKQFIEIAVKLKAMRRAGVPIPEEVQDYFRRNRNKSDVCFVLDDIIQH